MESPTVVKKIPIGSAEASALIASLRADPPVLFAGSAISQWEPSGLPTGEHFAESMYEVLFGFGGAPSTERDKVVKTLYQGLPFEHILELCPSPAKALALICALYDSRLANPVHQALAKALADGMVTSIITTNYDCGLDAALEVLVGFQFQRAVGESGAQKAIDLNTPCYFKIHGSIEPDSGESPVLTLEQEGFLPRPKRLLLRKLLEGRRVLLIGYSGLDFEICPEIARIPVVTLVWNSLGSDYPSPNARKLLANVGGTQLVGDMLALISEWIHPVHATRASVARPLGHIAASIFTEDEIAAWRVRILNSIGAPTPALEAIDRDKRHLAKRFAYWHRARAMFNSGKYLTAAAGYLQSCLLSVLARDRRQAAESLLEASDAFRSSGALLLGYVLVLVARILAPRSMSGHVLLKDALFLVSLGEVVALIRRGSMPRKLTRRLKRRLHAAASESVIARNWFDFQQIGLLATRIGMPLSELATHEVFPPPDPKDGYSHLGYYLASVMCLLEEGRDELAKPTTPARRAELLQECKRNIDICETIGLNTGTWKLMALAQSLAKDLPASSVVDRRRLKVVFAKCHYTPLMRVVQTRRYRGRTPTRRGQEAQVEADGA